MFGGDYRFYALEYRYVKTIYDINHICKKHTWYYKHI